MVGLYEGITEGLHKGEYPGILPGIFPGLHHEAGPNRKVGGITFFGESVNPADAGSLGDITTVTITPPPNMMEGQIVICIIQNRAASGQPAVSNAGGQTWISGGSANITNQRISWLWCRFNGRWTASPVFTCTAGSTTAVTGSMFVFNPTVFTNLWGVLIPIANNAFGASATITITNGGIVNNSVSLAAWLKAASGTWTLGSPTWTSALSPQYRNTAGNDQTASFAYQINNTRKILTNVSSTQGVVVAGISSIMTFYEYPNPIYQ